MSNQELYSPEGLRLDGRRWNELKSFSCKINTHQSSSDGSSYVQQGNTKVMCMVNGPIEPKTKSGSDANGAVISVNLNITSFSTVERRKRSKSDRRVKELVTILERTFSEAIITDLYPRTQIVIDAYVLSQDGGILSSVTNAITLAIIDAGIAMYDFISAANVGLYNNTTTLLDLNHLEENDMSFLTVGVIGKSEKVSLLLLEEKIPFDKLESLLSVGIAGAHRIKDLMDEELRRQGKRFLAKTANR